MGRPRIVEVDYYEFQRRLQRASDVGKRIDKTEKEKWSQYVKDHEVNEIAMNSWGRSKFENTQPVIINDGSSWEGFYVYSSDDEAVLKWEREEEA